MTQKHDHYKLYKPFGVLSQFTSGEERQLKKKRFLSEIDNFPVGTMPIGRLDEKSEGLLLLTRDGALSDRINSSGIEKEYLAQLDGEISSEAVLQLINGVHIGIFGEKYLTKHCFVEKIDSPTFLPTPNSKLRIGVHRPTSWIRIILTEGKFRQVRKMTASVGFPTARLVRYRVGNMTLENMLPGEVVPVSMDYFKPSLRV